MKKTVYLIIIVLIVLLSGVVYESHRLEDQLQKRIRDDLKYTSLLMSPTVEQYIAGNNLPGLKTYCQRYFAPQDNLNARVSIFTTEGRVLMDTWSDTQSMDNHLHRPEVQALLKKLTDEQHKSASTPESTLKAENTSVDDSNHNCCLYLRYSATQQQYMLYCIRGIQVNGTNYFLRTAIASSDVILQSHQIRRQILFIILMVVVSSVIVVWIIYWWNGNLASLLKTQATELANGTLKSELTIPRSGPLREIALALGNISGQLQHRLIEYSQEKNIRDAIFSSLTEGVIVLNSADEVIDINRSAMEMLGINECTVIGQSLQAVWRTPELKTWLTHPDEESGRQIEWELPDGVHTYQLQIRPVKWENNGAGTLMVLFDMTAFKKLEHYRRDFLANLSHEIKTPLTAISVALETLQDGAMADPDMAAAIMDTLVCQVQRMQTLLEDVLTLSRLERLSPCEKLPIIETPLEETAQIAIALCMPNAGKKGQTIVFDDQTDGQSFRFVPAMIEQVLVNLINNAVKYSVKNDTIYVRVRQGATPGQAILEVEDHGPGIAPEHIDRVFERFYRVDPSRSKQTGGTGLGLAIVKHIAQLHGGTATVQSIPGKGCLFIITLNQPCRDTIVR